MAAFVIKDGQVYYNEYNISGLLNSVTIDYSGDVPEANVLSGDGTKRRVSGLIDVSISCPGYLDASPADMVIYDRIGNVIAGDMSVAPQNPNEGSRAFFLKVHQGTYNILGAIGDVAPFSLDASSNHPLIKGVVGAIGSKDNIGGSGAVVDEGLILNLGAVPAGRKMYAMLHAVKADGTTPTLDVTIQSATAMGFGNTTDEITFTQVTGSPSHELISVDGPITNQFWRVEWEVNGLDGGTPSIGDADYDIFVALGIAV